MGIIGFVAIPYNVAGDTFWIVIVYVTSSPSDIYSLDLSILCVKVNPCFWILFVNSLLEYVSLLYFALAFTVTFLSYPSVRSFTFPSHVSVGFLNSLMFHVITPFSYFHVIPSAVYSSLYSTLTNSNSSGTLHVISTFSSLSELVRL